MVLPFLVGERSPNWRADRFRGISHLLRQRLGQFGQIFTRAKPLLSTKGCSGTSAREFSAANPVTAR